MNISETKSIKIFDGHTKYFEHESIVTKTKMVFSTFIPKGEVTSAIIWLSGLTCTEENFITKAGAQSYLKNSNTMIICPDTSPRGLELKGEHESYDFGSGAGFYLNATTEGYRDHYRMYDYIKDEVVSILKENFNIDNVSIMGHSMGGHGALILGLKEQQLFKSVSAFSPIVNPSLVPWGKKAFAGYLGEDKATYKQYDATELIKSGTKREDTILIDQGLADNFFEEHLKTELIENASKQNGQALDVRYREGYDHSYFYIATFIEEHIDFHLKALEC
jgi:S-formylglutathione hydrolase